jgi:hypothetical protein
LKKPNSNIPPLETKVLPSESGCDCVMVSIAEEILEKSNNTNSNMVIKGKV